MSKMQFSVLISLKRYSSVGLCENMGSNFEWMTKWIHQHIRNEMKEEEEEDNDDNNNRSF